MEDQYKSHHILPIVLDVDAKVEHGNKWRTYRERITQLYNQYGQAFSTIRGQCMQVLLDNMKHDTNWDTTSEPYDPLTLLKLIEKQYWIISKTNISVESRVYIVWLPSTQPDKLRVL